MMRYGTGMEIVLVAGLLWPFEALMIRPIEDAAPWAVLAWRSLAMVPVLLAFLAWRKGGLPLPAIRRAGQGWPGFWAGSDWWRRWVG
jgi:EamA domain-containing membrane protein RarD